MNRDGMNAGGMELRRHHFSLGDSYIALFEYAPSGCIDSVTPECIKGQPLLLFLHGRFGSAELWRPLMQTLFPHYRCLAVDFPGYGSSFSARERGWSLVEHAHLVSELLDRFPVPTDEVFLVGHDIGAAISQMCVVRAPHRFRGVILINCTGLFEPVKSLRPGWMGCVARHQLFKMLKPLRTARKLPEEILNRLSAPWRKSDARSALIRAWRAIEASWPGPFERTYWQEEMRKLDLPVLVLWGGQDVVNDPDAGLRLVHDLNEAYFFENDGVGHLSIVESPDWVAEKIEEFVFRVSYERRLSAG